MRKITVALAAMLALGAFAFAEAPVLEPIVTITVVSLDATPSPTPRLSPTFTPKPSPTSGPTPSPSPAPSAVIESEIQTSAAPVPTQIPSVTPAPAPGNLMRDSQTATTLSVGGLFSGGSTVLGSDIPRASITSIRFESSLNSVPATAWDVSAERNGSVIAWVVDGALTIAGEGGVHANPDCSYLFAGYSAAEEIDFNGSFFTDGVVNMAHMFESCWSLRALDVSGLDTSAAADLSYMFSSCTELAALDVSGLNTGRAESLEGMFLLDGKLTELDLSSFRTDRAVSLRSMFEGCTALRELDLTNFDISAVSDMRWMFGDCAALETIRLREDFAVTAQSEGLFDGCRAQLMLGERKISAQRWAGLGSYAGLKLWSRGETVRALQRKLIADGYALGSADGVFGHATEAALRAWQADHGFEATGVTDAEQAWELFG